MSDPENVAKKFLSKLEDMMAEISDEMIDMPTRTRIEEKLRKVLQNDGVAFNLPQIKAMYQGMRLILMAMSRDDQHMAMTLMMCTRGMITSREKVMKKVVDQSIEHDTNTTSQ